MFINRTAWFSESVERDLVRLWVCEGGVVTDWRTADYLFSEDSFCPDTRRIHMSDEYVMDKATVFHSTFLTACRLRQSTKSVPIGHYILPPGSVQKEVKARIGRFIWEQDEMPGVTMTHKHGSSTEQVLKIQPDANRRQTKKGRKRQEKYMNTSPSREESVCCEAQLYPVNNMVSGYAHIDQLKKYSGELHDFLPCHSGYSVSRSHNRRLPHQYKKTF